MSENNALSDGTAAREIDYVVHLRPGRERSVLRRHPWVFAGAIERLEERDTARPGGLGAVHGADGRQLGVSIVNPGAQLALRMLRWDAGPIDADWFAGALRRAGVLRERVVPQDTNAYRLLNAEGDGRPGLIIDRYADNLVVQCTALGMSRLDALWLAALEAAFPGHTILDRSQRARSDANLARKDGTLRGEAPAGPVEVREGGLRFRVDLAAGQKTGFYLDQRENRGRIAALCRGGRMLNAFAYTGSFAVWAGAHGAREVTCVLRPRRRWPWPRRPGISTVSRRRACGWFGIGPAITCARSRNASMSSSWTRRPSPSNTPTSRAPHGLTRTSTCGQ